MSRREPTSREVRARGPRTERRPGPRSTTRRTARPTTARRPVDSTRRQITLTARAAVLAVAIAAVAVASALPFKIWLGQREQIASLRAQTNTAAQQVSRLQTQHQRWKDPAYVEQQARERLHYVMPGQKTYVVLGTPTRPTASRAATRPPTATAQSAWYDRLWQTISASGATAAK